jgi:transcriptional regulator with XRE-family HTH domain
VAGTDDEVRKADLRAVIDARRDERRLTIAALAQRAGFNSQQALGGKLTGAVEFKVPELVRLAQVLELDAIELVCVRWPELAEADRLRTLRRILSGADEGVVSTIEELARGMVQ